MKFNLKCLGSGMLGMAAILVGLACNSQPTVPQTLLFGRVLFGPDKSDEEAVVHFIVRGNDIFVDKNKDDIPQPDELNETSQLELITDEDADATYQAHELRLVVNPQFVSEKLPQKLGLTVDVAGKVAYQQLGAIVLSPNPQSPDWVHFHGPMRLIFADAETPLVPGDETEVRVWVGNNAVGSAMELGARPTAGMTNSSYMTTSSDSELDETNRFANVVPAKNEMIPELKIEIATDGEPFITTLLLDDFC